MSSSQNFSNLLLDQAEISINRYFLRQLPFFQSNLDFSSAYTNLPAPSSSLFIHPPAYRGFRSPNSSSPSTPEDSQSNDSEDTLSPILPPLVPVDPFEWLLLESLNNLAINPPTSEELRSRLSALVILLNRLTTDLTDERDQAISSIRSLTDIAILTVRRRLLPEIERVEELLSRSD